MNVLIEKSASVNGNGAICGRGLPHRKLTTEEATRLAADVALGLRRFEPSLAQISAAFGIQPIQLREELKARAEDRSATHGRTVDSLVDRWNALSESERGEVFRRIGPAVVWDVLAQVIA